MHTGEEGDLSHKLYVDAAARQRAFRERRRTERADASATPTKVAGAPRRERSRSSRLTSHSDGLRQLSAEYKNWRDRLPRNLAAGETASRLDEVIADIDDIVERIESLDLPVVGE